MQLYIDIDSLRLVAGIRDSREISRLELKRGTTLALKIRFVRNKKLVRLDASTTLRFAVKPEGEYDADPLVFEDGFAQSAVGSPDDDPHWTGEVVFNTSGLNALYMIDSDVENDVPVLNFMAEFSWIATGDTTATKGQTFTTRINNDVYRGTESTLPAIADPDGYIADRAILYDRAQTLNTLESLEARGNARSGPAFGERVQASADVTSDENAYGKHYSFSSAGHTFRLPPTANKYRGQAVRIQGYNTTVLDAYGLGTITGITEPLAIADGVVEITWTSLGWIASFVGIAPSGKGVNAALFRTEIDAAQTDHDHTDFVAAVRHVTDDTTLDATDAVAVVTESAVLTVTLPLAASSPGVQYWIKKAGNAANVTIATAGSETIDGAADHVLTTQYDSVHLVSGGTNWHII